MQIEKDKLVVGGELILTKVEESISGIYLGVMLPRTTANDFNLKYGHAVKVTVSIKNKASIETTICNLVPIIRLLQFSQFGEGACKFIDTLATGIHNAIPALTDTPGDDMIGVAGFIPFTFNEGDYILKNDEYIEIKVSNCPDGTLISCNGIESKNLGEGLLTYHTLSVETDQTEKSFNDPNLVALIVPIGTTVEPDPHPSPSKVNPLDRLLTKFGNTDREQKRNDIELFNQMNNDIAFFTVTEYTGATAKGPIIMGNFDFGYVDVAGHSGIKFYKQPGSPLQFMGVKVSQI